MGTSTATRMDGIEISEFLAANETGVLALAQSDEAYAIPVSYATDGGVDRIYFRFGYGPGSEKRRFLEAAEDATFVVYGETDAGWKSVLARGRLETVSTSDIDNAVESAVRGLDIPYFRVHDRPTDELDFDVVALETTELSGVIEAVAGRQHASG